MNNLINIINEELKFINETVTDIVYHYTNINNAYNIIKNNEFNLSAAMGGSGAESLVNKNRFFFLSLTRSKSTGYNLGNVRLKIDGRKLSNNYKSVPVDYWQYSTNPKDWSSNKEYINRMKTGFEDEDRIVSNKSEIPNAKNYILEVSIRIDKNDNLSFPKRLYLICKQNNIPVFIFQNKNDFNLDNKKNAVNPNELFKNIEDVETNNNYSFRRFAVDLAALIAYNNDENKQKIINYLNDEKKINAFIEELEKRTYNNFRIGATYERDILLYINAEIHNMRSSTHPDDKFLLKLLAYDMRRLKAKNIAEYLKLKQWKNKKTLKQFNQEYKEFLLNTIDASISNIIHDQFSKSLEVNQNEYYDHAYEYPSLINQLMNYVNQIKNYVSNTIDANEDILNHSYSLSRDEIIRNLNFGNYNTDNIKLNLNIEYYHHYSGEEAYENLEYDFKKAIQYLLFEINDKYYDKGKELLYQYQKQLYEK